jgi:hypothetical protein
MRKKKIRGKQEDGKAVGEDERLWILLVKVISREVEGNGNGKLG